MGVAFTKNLSTSAPVSADPIRLNPSWAGSIFWPAAWLIVAVAAIKATYVTLSPFWSWATPRNYASLLFIRWAAAASLADVLFATGASVAFGAAIFAFRHRPRVARIAWVGFLVFGTICVTYAIVSRQVFAYYAAPLTYQLLSLSGETAKMSSSIYAFVNARAVIALAAAPLCYLLISYTSARRAQRGSSRNNSLFRAGFVVLVVAWVAIGQQFLWAEGQWFEAQDRHVPASPHLTLLRSALPALPGTRTNLGSTEVRNEDITELSPVASSASHPLRNSATEAAPPRPRNVVLIVLESVGTQYLSIYGSRYDTTPRLSGAAANAVIFDRYYAPVAWTAYSLIGLVLARRPPMERYNTSSFRTADLQGTSLPGVLLQSGYQTAFMAAGDPDWASGNFLQENGFQEVLRGSDFTGAPKVSSWGTEDRFLFQGMLHWIDKHRGKPFFLMGWTDQTHHPYEVAPDQKLVDVMPRKNGSQDDLGRYLSLVREADTQIGALIDSLQRRGLGDSTLIVVTGDHGEAFGRLHGGSGHGFTVYDEEIRVPLMLWNPKLFPRGMRSPVIGSHPDLAPTLLDLVGITSPAGWDGRSLFDPRKPPRAYFFAAAWGEYLLGVLDQNFKYVYDAREGRQELFDLKNDPNEQRNLATTDSTRSHRERQRLAALLSVERARAESRNR